MDFAMVAKIIGVALFGVIVAGVARRVYLRPFRAVLVNSEARHAGERKADPRLERVEETLGLVLPDLAEKAKRALSEAGMDKTVGQWRCEQILCAALFATSLAALCALLGQGALAPLALILGAALGLLFTRLWMRALAARRKGAIERSLPGAIELLSVLVGAGLPLERAIREVSLREAGVGEAAREFAIVSAEIDAGRPVPEALEGAADRCGIDLMTSLCGALALSSRQGTSVGAVLDAQAAEARNAWYEQVRKKVGFIEVLVQLPLCLCFVPAIVVMSMAPMVVSLTGQLQGIAGTLMGA